MAKKKTIYYQAVSYTTDHCDGDLIAPSCWEPNTDRAVAAKNIMSEINESFAGILATKKKVGPESITIEYRNSTDKSTQWEEPNEIKNWKRASKFLEKLANGLADGSICTVMVTVPKYVNAFMVQIDKRTDVFHINQFAL